MAIAGSFLMYTLLTAISIFWLYRLLILQPTKLPSNCFCSGGPTWRQDSQLRRTHQFWSNRGNLPVLSLQWQQRLQCCSPIPQIESTNAPSPILDVANWKPLSDVTYQLGDGKPVGIRFSGSITKPIKNWVDTWFEVCEWLATNGKLLAADCPVPSTSGKGVRVLYQYRFTPSTFQQISQWK